MTIYVHTGGIITGEVLLVTPFFVSVALTPRPNVKRRPVGGGDIEEFDAVYDVALKHVAHVRRDVRV